MSGELVKTKDVLKIGQRLEFFVGGSDERYTSRIEDITDDKLIVAMPMTKELVPVIPRSGEKLYALAIGDQCRFRFFTTFESSGKINDVLPIWYLKKPETVERHQNRAFVRIPVNLFVTVKLIDEEGTIAEPVRTPIVNLSGNGICFVMNKPISVGTNAGLELNDIPGIGTVEVMSIVARCTTIKRDGDTDIYHIGASFQDLPRATTNKIVQYLFSVQRQHIARGVK